MRTFTVLLIGAISATMAGCGAEVGTDDAQESAPEVGISTNALTQNLLYETRVNVGQCVVRLQINNFTSDEGVIGQASTLIESGDGDTWSKVATNLFGQTLSGTSGEPYPSRQSIATQWGNAFSSMHRILCFRAHPNSVEEIWTLDPFAKRATRVSP